VWALPSPSVSATGGSIQIAEVYYNSPGVDNGSNKSLNGEWVLLKNTGGEARSLKGWTLRDASHHVYKFGAFTLRAGKTVKIHTGRGSDTRSNLYWGQDSYIWNNDKDRATLKRPNGTVADRCSYSDSSASFKIC